MCTPAYHQSTNGQVERYVQILEKGLKLSIQNATGSQEMVDEILMFHRSTPLVTTGQTPAKLFMGREMQTRIDVMEPHSKVEIVKSSIPYKNKDRQSRIGNLEMGDMVQMRDYSVEGNHGYKGVLQIKLVRRCTKFVRVENCMSVI